MDFKCSSRRYVFHYPLDTGCSFSFIPQGLTVMELSRIYPSEGGIYQWVKHAFGEFHGFICGWCYWTSNLIYYPTLLIYMAGSSVYIFGDSTLYLEKNRLYNLIFCLVILWVAIILDTSGVENRKMGSKYEGHSNMDTYNG